MVGHSHRPLADRFLSLSLRYHVLFGLAGSRAKRPIADAGAELDGIEDDPHAEMQVARMTALGKSENLEKVARKLYRDPTLTLRPHQ